MKKEYYKRFKIKTVPGDEAIAADIMVEGLLNTKIEKWLQEDKEVKSYRITNVEHTFLPAPAMSPGNPVVYIVVNIAYSY